MSILGAQFSMKIPGYGFMWFLYERFNNFLLFQNIIRFDPVMEIGNGE
jgi:hypothetical protein